MAGKIFFEQTAIDSLGGHGALAGGNDHLAIGPSDASGGVKSIHRGSHIAAERPAIPPPTMITSAVTQFRRAKKRAYSTMLNALLILTSPRRGYLFG